MNNIFTEFPEKEYLKTTCYNYRKKLGQFFTPIIIADLMTEWVINGTNNVKIVDPALGLGIFFRTIIKNHPDKIKLFKFIGYEIDKNIMNLSEKLFSEIQDINLQTFNKNYLIDDWEKKFDGIVCNPPYLKFNNYKSKDNLLKIFEEKLRIKLSGFTNIYTLFILKSIWQLNEEGRAAYIVPSEFLNADYGKYIKKYIKESGTLRFVIIIDFNLNVFENATTTSSILLFAKDQNNEELEFINIKSLEELNLIKNYILSYPSMVERKKVIKIKELDETQKWRIYYQELNRNKYKYLVPFSQYAKITRGIATGNNNYFMFSESKRIKYEIDIKFLLPCLAKASYVNQHFFTNNMFETLKETDNPIYLLNATDLSDKNLRKYIEIGEKQGIHKYYLTSHKSPWYLLDKRPPAPILVKVFNRTGLKFIRNEANVYNLTAFHCVYLKPNFISKIDLLMAYLITDVAQEIFEDNKREYGKGLKKFEPNDLNNAFVVDLEKITSYYEQKILTLFYEFKDKELKGENTISIKNELNEIFLEIFRK